jgi:hypothetical protein
MTEQAGSLRRGIETCQKALSGELLPHQVDAWELWKILSEASDKLSESEEYLLYATLLRLIVATVRLQCRWLRYEADELYVDADMAREKVHSLSVRTLGSIFVKSFHPLVEMERMTLKALEVGKRHWDELAGREIQNFASPEQFLTYQRGSEVESQVLREVRFQELLEDLMKEFPSGDDGSDVSYESFISQRGSAGFSEMVTRSYLVSFLITQRRLSLKADGTGLMLSRTAVPAGTTQSVAVILRQRRDGVHAD